jgi:hypothetical protein
MTRHANKPVIDRTSTSLVEMELWLGPSPRIGSVFSDDDERRRLWEENRPRLMQLFANGGRRPQAWWRYESPIPWPGFALERSSLWEAGLLDKAEARELVAHWHAEFEHSVAPGFTYLGLTGREAHIAHLVHCDCPATLAEKWAAEVEAA